MPAEDTTPATGQECIDTEKVQEAKRAIVKSRFYVVMDGLKGAARRELSDDQLVDEIDDAIVELTAVRDLVESSD